LDILNFSTTQFSTIKSSEAITNLKNQLISFQTSILLPKDKHKSMGLINTFNFLLENCINSYETFNNICSFLHTKKNSSTYDSIGSSTEEIVRSYISKIYNLSISLIGQSLNLSENSTLEQIINEVSTSVSTLFNKFSKHFSQQKSLGSQSQQNSLVSFITYLLDDSNQSFSIACKILSFLDPTIQTTGFTSIHEFLFAILNKFEELIEIFEKNSSIHFGSEIKLLNYGGFIKLSQDLFKYFDEA
jgi:hypothetical protein